MSDAFCLSHDVMRGPAPSGPHAYAVDLTRVRLGATGISNLKDREALS
jgi:hypothetical protein